MDVILNKSASYVLLQILQGATTATEIADKLATTETRTIQRALTTLTDAGIILRNGTNHPCYAPQYGAVLRANISEKVLEDENRPRSLFNFDLLTWFEELTSSYRRSIFSELSAVKLQPSAMTRRDLEHLTIELSWKSSALEGNTYTLLDTELLIKEGVTPNNRTSFETQMILNHKNAIGFIFENPELFRGDLKLSSVIDLHRIIIDNLGITDGVRKKPVRITTSQYQPLDSPHQLEELAVRVLRIINRYEEPILRAFLALVLIPYLQFFEDGNKRTGRLLSNAILISTIGSGFSLRSVSARELALAYLDFYEFNSIVGLEKIFLNELLLAKV